MTLREIRERVNVFLHPHRESTLSVLRAMNVLISLTAFASLVAYYGYPLESDTAQGLIGVIKARVNLADLLVNVLQVFLERRYEHND